MDENGKVIGSDIHYLETYHALEELVTEGKVKSIGVSNFNISQLQDVLDNCKIKPVCNQFEVHPLFQNKDLVSFCLKNDVEVVAYAPLGAPDRAWLKPEDPVLLETPFLLELSSKHKKTPAQVILRWLVQRGITPIPKSVTPSRIQENSQVCHQEITNFNVQIFKKTLFHLIIFKGF
jgi:diketogulonate reductase-like aldo/keto reductase